MAEKSAHLTSTTQTNPSIFDYIAQEALNDLLNPAAKKVVEAVYIKYPKLQFLLKWYDETFLLSASLLHLYYLKNYGKYQSPFLAASVAEWSIMNRVACLV